MMDPKVLEAWDNNHMKLEQALRTVVSSWERKPTYLKYGLIRYDELLAMTLFNLFEPETFNFKKQHAEICFGEEQGTRIWVFPEGKFTPMIRDHWYTYVDYGSCEGCDALLQAIDQSTPELTVQSLKTLAMHLMQNMKRMHE